MKRRRSDGVVVSVLVLIFDPIRGVAMDQFVEVRPLLQILLERVAPARGGRRGVAAVAEMKHRRSRVSRAGNGARRRRLGVRR